MFGTGYYACNSFDDTHDAQDPEPIGFPALTGGIGAGTHDFGSTFSDVEEEGPIETTNTTRHIHRKGTGKHFRHRVLQARDHNVMAKRQGKAAPGAAGSRDGLRSNTEGDRLKDENAKLKRRVEELQKAAKEDSVKKAKTKKTEVKAIIETDGTWAEIEKSFRRKVWPHIKFLNNEEEELEVMTLTLMNTSEWRRLKTIPECELEEHVKPYLTVYGTQLCSLMNKARSEDQSAVRTRYLKDVNSGMKVSAKMYLWLLQRPDHLLILEEDTDDPEQNAKHKEENEKNQYHRERLQHFLTKYVDKGAPTKTWTPEIQATRTLSNYKDNSGKDVIPPECEAAIILYIENNEKEVGVAGWTD